MERELAMATVQAPRSKSELFAADAVQAIHAFSTGRAFQHKEHRQGSALPQLWWVLTSQSWVGLPISVFLIEHKDGLVLFDTGLDPTIATDPSYISQAIGRFLLKRIFRFEIGPEDRLDAVLGAHGFDAGDIRKAIISHLHFDHIGGLSHIPQAELLVSNEEWAQLSEPNPEREWILREHIELPDAKWTQIDFQAGDDFLSALFGGSYDVMGDGSLVLLPTPGHTPGSMSLLVRSMLGPPILLIGDLAYYANAIMNDRIPGTGNAKQLRESYAKLRQLKTQIPDLLIVPSHDDESIAELKLALDQEANHG